MINVLLPKNMQSTIAFVEVDKLENPTSIGTEIIASSNPMNIRNFVMRNVLA